MTRVNFKDLEGDRNDTAWNRLSSSKAQTSKCKSELGQGGTMR